MNQWVEHARRDNIETFPPGSGTCFRGRLPRKITEADPRHEEHTPVGPAAKTGFYAEKYHGMSEPMSSGGNNFRFRRSSMTMAVIARGVRLDRPAPDEMLSIRL